MINQSGLGPGGWGGGAADIISSIFYTSCCEGNDHGLFLGCLGVS